MFFLLFNLFI